MERVQEKQRADDERLARDRTLSARPEWRQLLAAIDGPQTAAVQFISQLQQPSPPKPAAASSSVSGASSPNQIVNELQWKSTHVPIAAASIFQLPIKLDALKGVLRYEFHTRDYDVNFSGEYGIRKMFLLPGLPRSLLTCCVCSANDLRGRHDDRARGAAALREPEAARQGPARARGARHGAPHLGQLVLVA